MTGTPIHVLIVGADASAVSAATVALAGAGHVVSHVTPESGTPFMWPGTTVRPFEAETVDVVLSIPGRALSSVPWCEDQVIDLVHRGVPLVLAGTPLASPFTAWASHCVDLGANLVHACESAVHRQAPWRDGDGGLGTDADRDVTAARFGPIDFDQSGGEVLTRRRCLALLGTATVGRVGFTSGALPVVVPVDYRMWRDHVVFRAEAGCRLHRATRDAVVAFEVDALSPTYPWGWSVVVTGLARDITDTDPSAATQTDFPNEGWWASGRDERLLAVPTDVVAGCRLHAVAHSGR